jgi:hypothetical protein
VYRWDFDDPARQHFASLSSAGQEELAAFMNAAVLVYPPDDLVLVVQIQWIGG